MKTTKVLFVAMLLSLAFMWSCQKEGAMTPDASGSSAKDTEDSFSSKNPSVSEYEIFGIAHNEMMDYVAANADLSTYSAYQRYMIGKNFVYSGLENEHESTWSEMESIQTLSDSLLDNYNDAENILVDANAFSEDFVAPAAAIYSLLGSMLESADNSIIVSPDQFSSMIQTIEDNILQNYEVEYDSDTKLGNEGAKLLGACTIARYSYMYWYNVAIDESNPWGNTFTDGNGERLKNIWNAIKHAIKVAAADVGGFVGCGTCTHDGVYSLNEAWENGGDKSDSVE